jgi:hypothetical protein
MPELDPTETRLREELHGVDTPLVDVDGLLVAGRRRARRRAVRRRAVAGAGVAGLAVAAIAIVVLPRDRPDVATDSQTPTSSPAPTTEPLPDDVPLGESTTWPGGPFDPIDGMVAVPGARPLPDDEAAEIYRAEERLLSACMARQGYEPDVSMSGAGPLPLYLSPTRLRAGGYDYEYDWAVAAEQFVDNSGGSNDMTEGMSDEELEAYTTALDGASGFDVTIETHDGTVSTSSDGCVGESRAEVYGTVANFLRYAELRQAFAGVSDQLREHDEYTQPLTDWQACMGDAGFDVGDHDYGASWIQRQGAVALSNEGSEQTQFTAETIPAIAAADADCQETSGLYDVRESLLADIPQEIAADLGVDFDHYIAYEHALYQRARQVP